MSMLQGTLGRSRLILTLAALFSLTGVLSWITMVRQEDPRLPEYWGQIVVAFPGAEAEQVERLVLKPVEDHLAEVDEIHWIESTAFAEFAVLFLELRQDIQDTSAAWDEIRDALETAQREFPDGVTEPALNDEVGGEQESVVFALTGSPDPLELLAAARKLKQALLSLSQVAMVHIVADPGEQVTVELDDSAARRLGTGAPELTTQLSGRNTILPGGTIRLGNKSVSLRPMSDFASVEEIKTTPVVLPSGVAIPLSEVAQVRLGSQEPAASRMRFNSEMAVGLGVVAKKGTDLVSYGDEVRALVNSIRASFAPIAIQEVMFQPQRVEARLDQLSQSLLLGIVIVAGVVIMAMGMRLGLLVASVVPLVAMASLAVYSFGGGVLHQISIAALVLALGMLVDNAIVMAESVQRRLDRGVAPKKAAVDAVRELAIPLGGATATTLAAFVPMLLSHGSTAAFTRAIPVVVMLTLTVSYIFAVFVTPILSQRLLVPNESQTIRVTDHMGSFLAKLATHRPITVLVLAGVVVATSITAGRLVQKQFFPAADRNQVVIDLKLPEGTHLDTTDSKARLLELALMARPDVRSVASFMGRSAPKFYYNLSRVPWSPHFAQLVVETQNTRDVSNVVDATRTFAQECLPGAEVIPRRLEQGPPVDAPVEIRLTGYDLQDLNSAATVVADALENTSGTVDVRHDMSPGAPILRFRIDDAAAARHGFSRAHVAQALYGQTRGLTVGQMHGYEDPIPVVVRSSAGEHTATQDLAGLGITRQKGSSPGGTVPLAQVARIEAEWRPAAIKHRDRQRVVTVSSQLAKGVTFSDVIAAFSESAKSFQLPEGVQMDFGGDVEGSGEANAAMLGTLPIGLILLLGILLAEFNSFRRVGIVLVTVPLASAGVIPGLLIGQQPFGFMSMLGVIALVGIVVNNAIVLLEVVERRRREGASIPVALNDAVVLRIRPILLTTATTVAGLLPLAFSESTLWPPLASAMISGLLASTMLTLIVVPALYRVMFPEPHKVRRDARKLVPQVAIVVLAAIFVIPIKASEGLDISLETSMRLASERPAALATRQNADAIAQRALAERRLTYLPIIGASAEAFSRNQDLILTTPIGDLALEARNANSAGVELRQPLLDPAGSLFGNPASRMEADAARHQAVQTRQELAFEAAMVHLHFLDLQAQLKATEVYESSLAARLAEVRSMVEAGRALEADAIKIQLALEQAQLQLEALQQSQAVALSDFARTTGVDHAHPLPVNDWRDRGVPDTKKTIVHALRSRADLSSMSKVSQALDMRRKQVRAESLPRLDFTATWSWSDGAPYQVDNWAEAALVVRWNPFASGTRAPRSRALAAQRNAMDLQLEELRRAVDVQVRSALANLETARKAVSVSQRGVEMALENLRVERERHLSGRTTTNDLLDAEAELRAQRTRFDQACLQVVRAWTSLWLAVGDPKLDSIFGESHPSSTSSDPAPDI